MEESDDDTEEEVVVPVKKGAKTAPVVVAPVKATKAVVPAKKPVVESSEEESSEEVKPVKAATKAVVPAKVVPAKVAAKKRPAGTQFGNRKRKDNSRSAYTLIYLNESETVTLEGVINRRSDVSAHYVRGHFKQRVKGVYWWNPFVRGSGKPKERVAYRVKEGTA